jgi:hypothetical protein
METGAVGFHERGQMKTLSFRGTGDSVVTTSLLWKTLQLETAPKLFEPLLVTIKICFQCANSEFVDDPST